MRIALVCPDDFTHWLFRRGLIRALLARGHQVFLLSAPGPWVPSLEKMGAEHIAVDFYRYINALRDAKAICQMFRAFRRGRFDIVHNFTVKPNTYGTIVARLCGCRTIFNSIEGLGYLYRNPWESGLTVSLTKKLVWGAVLCLRSTRPTYVVPEP
jgi:hypothetical protein